MKTWTKETIDLYKYGGDDGVSPAASSDEGSEVDCGPLSEDLDDKDLCMDKVFQTFRHPNIQTSKQTRIRSKTSQKYFGGFEQVKII